MKPMPNPTLTLIFWLQCDLPSVHSSYQSHSVLEVCVIEISLRIYACNNNYAAFGLYLMLSISLHTHM